MDKYNFGLCTLLNLNNVHSMENNHINDNIKNIKEINVKSNNNNSINATESETKYDIFIGNIKILNNLKKDYLVKLKDFINLKNEQYEEKKGEDKSSAHFFDYLSFSELEFIWSTDISTVFKCKIPKGNDIFKNKNDIVLCYKFVKDSCYEKEKIPFFLKKKIKKINKNIKGFKNVVDIKRILKNDYINLITTPFYPLRDLGRFNKNLRKNKIINNFKIATLFYFKQIIDGYGLLYNNNIFHSDLKPENIFISGDLYLKIADFSVSKIYNKNKPLQLNDGGTKIYMPREQLLLSELKGCDVNKVDMYCIGGILYMSLFGKNWVNFDNIIKDNQKYANKIDKTELVINDIDKTTEDLLRKLLAKKYKERASYTDIINSDIYKLTEEIEIIHEDWITQLKTKEDIKKNNFYLFLPYLENNEKFIDNFEEKLQKCKPIEIKSNNNNNNNDVLNNPVNNNSKDNINNSKDNINNINDNK